MICYARLKLIFVAFTLTSLWARSEPPSLAAVLEPIRAKHKIPALAGGIFTTEGLVEMDAVGVRKAGTDVPVTKNDLWHLGSDTKMMTAALAGTFVVEGKLSWNDKIISFFPDLADRIPEAMRQITVAQVLSHHAGLAENLKWNELSRRGSLREQRREGVREALTAPAFPVGTYHYANTDYVVIGAILEKLGDAPWEDLIRKRIFQPLGMASAGFGSAAKPGELTEPWPHYANGWPFMIGLMDNPEVMVPAGAVHGSLQDWAKFLVDQLRGGTGEKALLPRDIYQAMQTAVPPGDYGFGWGICQRPWAGGKALNHSGSNTMNFAVCWLAPGRKFGVLVCCNQGGDEALKACDEAAFALIQRHLAAVE